MSQAYQKANSKIMEEQIFNFQVYTYSICHEFRASKSLLHTWQLGLELLKIQVSQRIPKKLKQISQPEIEPSNFCQKSKNRYSVDHKDAHRCTGRGIERCREVLKIVISPKRFVRHCNQLQTSQIIINIKRHASCCFI